VRTRLREALELTGAERNERAARARECLKARLDWSMLAGRYETCYREAMHTAHR